MSDEIKDRNIRDIRELARAVSDELSRENPKYMDSLRDHFAGLAMQGYCANPDPQTATSPQERIADWAYAQADAMLRAREAGQ